MNQGDFTREKLTAPGCSRSAQAILAMGRVERLAATCGADCSWQNKAYAFLQHQKNLDWTAHPF